jgi:hypothetical protein
LIDFEACNFINIVSPALCNSCVNGPKNGTVMHFPKFPIWTLQMHPKIALFGIFRRIRKEPGLGITGGVVGCRSKDEMSPLDLVTRRPLSGIAWRYVRDMKRNKKLCTMRAKYNAFILQASVWEYLSAIFTSSNLKSGIKAL